MPSRKNFARERLGISVRQPYAKSPPPRYLCATRRYPTHPKGRPVTAPRRRGGAFTLRWHSREDLHEKVTARALADGVTANTVLLRSIEAYLSMGVDPLLTLEFPKLVTMLNAAPIPAGAHLGQRNGVTVALALALEELQRVF